jgi:flagellar operon protein
MNKINNRFTSIEQITDRYLGNKGLNPSETKSDTSFEEILRQKADGASGVKFSKHAAMRLLDRNIQMSAEQSERLETGVTKAREKGINESLVMVDSLAFIVNVPNKTVVTAIDQNESMEHIFTNIDGAVIA